MGMALSEPVSRGPGPQGCMSQLNLHTAGSAASVVCVAEGLGLGCMHGCLVLASARRKAQIIHPSHFHDLTSWYRVQNGSARHQSFNSDHTRLV